MVSFATYKFSLLDKEQDFYEFTNLVLEKRVQYGGEREISMEEGGYNWFLYYFATNNQLIYFISLPENPFCLFSLLEEGLKWVY